MPCRIEVNIVESSLHIQVKIDINTLPARNNSRHNRRQAHGICFSVHTIGAEAA